MRIKKKKDGKKEKGENFPNTRYNFTLFFISSLISFLTQPTLLLHPYFPFQLLQGQNLINIIDALSRVQLFLCFSSILDSLIIQIVCVFNSFFSHTLL